MGLAVPSRGPPMGMRHHQLLTSSVCPEAFRRIAVLERGRDNLRTPDKLMGTTSAVLLAGYFGLAVYESLSSSDDPQRGMAQGFIILVALVLLLLAGALWFGIVRKHPWVIRIVFAITAFPALSQIAQEIYLLTHRGP